MALVPVRTWRYASTTASQMQNPHVGNGIYIELGNYEEFATPYPMYFTNGYFINARFKFNRIVTMFHESGTSAQAVFLEPLVLHAYILKLSLTPAAKSAAMRNICHLLRRSLLLRILYALWRARYAYRKYAATVIQGAWREAWYNPKRGLCKRRINREWESMLVEV